MGAQENEEKVINEAVLKVDEIEKSLDYGAFLLAHE